MDAEVAARRNGEGSTMLSRRTIRMAASRHVSDVRGDFKAAARENVQA